ncbi:MAG: response regulator transcription factor [Chloroflexi bacterium]|nr:response regulator transcription factor [Chloroflexota bacterium]
MDTGSKILVLDDEVGIRYYLERTLARDGHHVVAAENGEQALEYLATQEFDLALIDLHLKGIDGMTVLREIHRRWSFTPVIVLTAHASMESAVEAMRLGAHDYLFKPCATVDLRESIRTGLLKRQGLVRSQTWQMNDASSPVSGPQPKIDPPSLEQSQDKNRFIQSHGLIVDPIRHIITLDGCLLELSPTEFNLLAYLVGEAPRVVSSQELVREVLGYESESWQARDTMRSHIYHVRQKAKAAAGRDVIQTVRGVGYALTESSSPFP